MTSLRSKKLSSGALAALAIVAWYIGLNAPDNDSLSPTTSPSLHLSPQLRLLPQSLQALKAATQLSSALTSDQATHSVAGDNLISSHQRVSVSDTTELLQSEPAQPTQRAMESEREDNANQMTAEVLSPTVNGGADESKSSADMPPTAAASPAGKDVPQSTNLLKLLAVYYMLNR